MKKQTGKQKETYIYALQDPFSGEIRYVGKSNNPKHRYSQHISDGINKRKKEWMRSLKKRGARPNLLILDVVENKKETYKAAETSWVRFLLSVGCNLTNWIYKGYSNKEMLGN